MKQQRQKPLHMRTHRHALARYVPAALCLLSSLIFSGVWLRTACAFDHDHGAWSSLLERYVHISPEGTASAVDYARMEAARPALQAYLDSLSAVPAQAFAAWPDDARMAFLINAYNAFTVLLILDHYPDIDSIKDIGGLLRSPWKIEFIPLFGRSVSLDHIEHDLLRDPESYRDPRIHFVLTCASVGCPMLDNRAYTAYGLDKRLEEAMARFLSDRSRNYVEPNGRVLRVSPIFDWYEEDFSRGWLGFETVPQTLARFAPVLSSDPAVQAAIRRQELALRYGHYDWSLNDWARAPWRRAQ